MELSRSVLVAHSPEAMFDLIEHAEDYPQFLPWCSAATVFERDDESIAARLEFCYLHVRFGFRTANRKRRPEWLQVRGVEGPFRRFHAEWRLARLGDLGCRIDFDVSYEIADGVLARLARPAVDRVSTAMMDAFVRRADGLALPAATGAVAPAAATARVDPSLPPPVLPVDATPAAPPTGASPAPVAVAPLPAPQA
ncbi:MAG: type II toxin-antitoxin system RatA family toxin [Burkholderiaceae bacterium]